MIDFVSESKKIFANGSKDSVFDNIAKLKSLLEAAEDEAADPAEEGGEAGEEGAEAEAPADPTQPAPEAAEAEPAEESEGVYISPNEKAVMAKTMLDALQAQPPATGEIPQELLNVTDANADQVIKYVQSLISLASALDTSATSDSNPDSLVSALKQNS